MSEEYSFNLDNIELKAIQRPECCGEPMEIIPSAEPAPIYPPIWFLAGCCNKCGQMKPAGFQHDKPEKPPHVFTYQFMNDKICYLIHPRNYVTFKQKEQP